MGDKECLVKKIANISGTLEKVLVNEAAKIKDAPSRLKKQNEAPDELEKLTSSEIQVLSAAKDAPHQTFVLGSGEVRDSSQLFEFEIGGKSTADYRREGNIEFYTAENLEKRRAMAEDAVVKKWMNIFWNTFDSVQQTGEVNSTEYIAINMSIAKAIFDPEDWDEEETRLTVEADWVRENGTATSMNEQKFYKSLFELVDTWALSCRLVEYRMFLQRLYFRITSGNTGHKSLLKNSTNIIDTQQERENGQISDNESTSRKKKYQRQLRKLVNKQRRLTKHLQLYTERISNLSKIGHDIAIEATAVREAKQFVIDDTSRLNKEECIQETQLSTLENIQKETDKNKRAALLAKALEDKEDLVKGGKSISAQQDEKAMIEKLILIEQRKLIEGRAKRDEFLDSEKGLCAREKEIQRRGQEIEIERSKFEQQIQNTQAKIQKIEHVSTNIQEQAKREGLPDIKRRRSFTSLNEVKSLRHISNNDMIHQIRADQVFLEFCSDNNLEVQEDVEGDVVSQVGNNLNDVSNLRKSSYDGNDQLAQDAAVSDSFDEVSSDEDDDYFNKINAIADFTSWLDSPHWNGWRQMQCGIRSNFVSPRTHTGRARLKSPKSPNSPYPSKKNLPPVRSPSLSPSRISTARSRATNFALQRRVFPLSSNSLLSSRLATTKKSVSLLTTSTIETRPRTAPCPCILLSPLDDDIKG